MMGTRARDMAGVPALYVTHRVEEIEALGGAVVTMEHGQG